MKLGSKLTFATFMLCAVASVPSVVRAEDDNVTDGKNYPGNLCDSVLSSTLSARVAGFYANNSGATTSIICPVIQDSWQSSAGLAFSRMMISNPFGGVTFSCTQTSYTADGTVLGSRSFSTTTGGVSSNYFWNGTSYGPTTADGYISIMCTVPSGGQVRSYQIQEKA